MHLCNSRRFARLSLSALLFALVLGIGKGTGQVQPPSGFRTIVTRTVPINQPLMISSPTVSANHLYSVTVSCDPATFIGASQLQIAVTISDSEAIGAKTLHVGDPDLYVLFRPRKNGPLRVVLSPKGAPTTNEQQKAAVKIVEWQTDADNVRNIAYKPN